MTSDGYDTIVRLRESKYKVKCVRCQSIVPGTYSRNENENETAQSKKLVNRSIPLHNPYVETYHPPFV